MKATRLISTDGRGYYYNAIGERFSGRKLSKKPIAMPVYALVDLVTLVSHNGEQKYKQNVVLETYNDREALLKDLERLA